MTGTDIQQSIQRYLGASVAPADVIAVVNECLDAIGDRALIHDTIPLTLVARVWEELPNVTSIIGVLVNNKPYNKWQTKGTSIRVHDAGDYVVKVRKMADHIDGIGDTVEIHRLFHFSILCYVRGTFKLFDDDESADGHKLIQQFEEETNKAYETLTKIRTQ